MDDDKNAEITEVELSDIRLLIVKQKDKLQLLETRMGHLEAFAKGIALSLADVPQVDRLLAAIDSIVDKRSYR